MGAQYPINSPKAGCCLLLGAHQFELRHQYIFGYIRLFKLNRQELTTTYSLSAGAEEGIKRMNKESFSEEYITGSFLYVQIPFDG